MKIAYGKDQKINGKLQNDFDADYAFLERALEHSGDIVKNMFFTSDGTTRAVVIYVDGMTDAQTVQDFVIRPLLCVNLREECGAEKNLLSFVENHVIETVDWKNDEDYEEILTDILAGNTILLVEGCEKAISLSTKHFPTRDGHPWSKRQFYGKFPDQHGIDPAANPGSPPENGTYHGGRAFQNRSCHLLYGRSGGTGTP